MFYVEAERRRSAKRGRQCLDPCRICNKAKGDARLAKRYAIADAMKLAGCTDCGHTDPEHPEVFDFDHMPEYTKIASVATLLTKGTLEEFKAEIAKCEVVCANCHRIRTRRLRDRGVFGKDRGPKDAGA